jgi:hypothetical protein
LTTPDVQVDRPLDRRLLLRGGAVLAGAAGATAIGAALSPTKANAANDDPIRLGADNSATLATSVRIGGVSGSPAPTLILNNANGPTLALEALPQGTEISLGVGEIVNTAAGPEIGVDYGDGNFTTFLATGMDVTNAYPIQAERVLDTRSVVSRRDDVVDGSPGQRFDSLGRLAGKKYIDVPVARADGLDMAGVFLNVTAVRPSSGGYVEVYTPGLRRAIASLSYSRHVTLTNSVFVAPAISTDDAYYVVRVYTTHPTHLVVDVLGAVTGYPAEAAAEAASPSRTPVRRQVRQAKQRARLIKAVQAR